MLSVIWSWSAKSLYSNGEACAFVVMNTINSAFHWNLAFYGGLVTQERKTFSFPLAHSSHLPPPLTLTLTRHYPKLHLNKQDQHLVFDEVMSGFFN